MEIRVPTLAEGVEEGTVVSVLVKEGDTINANDTVVELETNKAVAPIPAEEGGTVTKVHVKEGDVVPVGGVLVSLGGEAASEAPKTEKDSAPTPSQQKPEEKKQDSKEQKETSEKPAAKSSDSSSSKASAGDFKFKSPTGQEPPASPSVRKIARELGIDLRLVRGTESGGRVCREDLKNYIAALQEAAKNASSAKASSSEPKKKAAPKLPDFSKWGPVRKEKLTPLRKTISGAMSNSWSTVPRITQFDDLNLTPVMDLRKKHVKEYEKKGTKLTVTGFVIKAIANTLKKNPVFNSSLDEAAGEIVFKDYVHIGIAVDTEHGLMVPVLRDADKKSLLDISKELAELAAKTRDRKIGIEEMQGASFTISNQGGIGGKHFTPIVNVPEVAIIGLGRAYGAPVYVGDELKKQMLMPIGLSYDHRVIDGAKAAKFVVDLAEELQNFSSKDAAL